MQTLYGNQLSSELKKLCENSKKRIWICCPFIGSEKFILQLIGHKFIDEKIDLRLITDIDELSKINYSFISNFLENSKLKSLPGVHAKIYIIDNNCLITSANLTETAFTKRHEIGVFLYDNEANETIEIFENWWRKSETINEIKLDDIPIKKHNNDEKFGFNLPRIWNKPSTISQNRYWLKPIGVTENPITEKNTFEEQFFDLHFAVNPSSIKENDIFIAYGIGAKRILGVYKGMSKVLKIDENEQNKEDWKKRWPYYVKSENLTPEFGRIWMQKNLYATKLVVDFLKINANKNITHVGGKTLGALNFKKDKILLSNEFAEFIISKITNEM